jgi:hypothetical protein
LHQRLLQLRLLRSKVMLPRKLLKHLRPMLHLRQLQLQRLLLRVLRSHRA